MSEEKEKGQSPESSTKSGQYESATFKNEHEKDGNKFDVKNTSLTKNWVKKDGDPKKPEDWDKQTMSIPTRDIPKVILTLQEEYRKHTITEKKEE